ncbi:uncharacterized protein K460DRAFT_393453 [Cucurbitaria berberidis CBS 394.84]|uniref:Uncharacterized protein n=1 Tax=Cucurbitaria berberidis CBS 394.84 TaxID=1168544 RepID=A0A9P4LAG6_9PLEO|nr:uncharacterized protein K460DRAFT_393453 [Cucurbitaria berberidis CBS 394.84]KAF1848361.1 hypothetical protein K460DRAFT_393453 [Cucurbitaria berberidis CBS 394.84]
MVPTYESAPLLAAQDDSGYRLFESIATPVCQTQQECGFNLPEAFREFQELESKSWTHPRRKDELVAPSGSLSWPIAHYLHNPSFQTLTPHEEETEDATSSCIWMIIANNFVSGKTFIFDHLSRRESVDGLQVYPQTILDLHETWLSKIRSNMAAKVEVVYGKKVSERMPQIYDLEPLQLWGGYKDIVLYLEWLSTDSLPGKSLARFVVPAYHPQAFLSPGGARYGVRQDTILRVAHELAGLIYKDGFYKSFNTTMINKSGVRPHHYIESRKLAVVAGEELAKNIAELIKPNKLRPISRVRPPPDELEIVRFNKTKSFKLDAKPAVYQTKITNRFDPSANTSTQLHPGFTRTLDVFPPLSFSGFVPNRLVQGPEPHPDLTLSKALVEDSPPSLSPPLALSSALATPLLRPPVASKGYNSREIRQFGQTGEKGPFEYWHGHRPVMSKMGRVRIWVLRNKQSKAVKIQRLGFSTYGPYLLKTGSRILDSNDRGVSLVSLEGKELWHASLDQLRSQKNGSALVEHHKHELKQQGQ